MNITVNIYYINVNNHHLIISHTLLLFWNSSKVETEWLLLPLLLATHWFLCRTFFLQGCLLCLFIVLSLGNDSLQRCHWQMMFLLFSSLLCKRIQTLKVKPIYTYQEVFQSKKSVILYIPSSKASLCWPSLSSSEAFFFFFLLYKWWTYWGLNNLENLSTYKKTIYTSAYYSRLDKKNLWVVAFEQVTIRKVLALLTNLLAPSFSQTLMFSNSQFF